MRHHAAPSVAAFLLLCLCNAPSAFVEEPRALYPQATVLGNLTTPGLKEEIRKHDRRAGTTSWRTRNFPFPARPCCLVVQAMAFMNSLTPSQLEAWRSVPRDDPHPLLIQVLLVNRAIPYIDVLLTMLMVGNAPATLHALARVQLLYVERRPERVAYGHLATLKRLPFVEVLDWSRLRHKGLERLGWQRKYFMGLLLDYQKALETFLASGSRWCLILEEDAVPPVHFLDLLQRFVLLPLRAREANLSSVSLFACHTAANALGLPQLLLGRWDYGGLQYGRDRAKLNVERRAAGDPPYRPNFTLRPVAYPVGGVAQLFSRTSAKKLVAYLKTQDLKTCRPLDNLLNMDNRFPAYARAPRLQVEPSLVNHLGFYTSRTKASATSWGNLKTDVRFQLDPGP